MAVSQWVKTSRSAWRGGSKRRGRPGWVGQNVAVIKTSRSTWVGGSKRRGRPGGVGQNVAVGLEGWIKTSRSACRDGSKRRGRSGGLELAFNFFFKKNAKSSNKNRCKNPL